MTPREEIAQAQLRMGQKIGRWTLDSFDLDAKRGEEAWVSLSDGEQRRIICKSQRGDRWLVCSQIKHAVCGWIYLDAAPERAATFAEAIELVRAA